MARFKYSIQDENGAVIARSGTLRGAFRAQKRWKHIGARVVA